MRRPSFMILAVFVGGLLASPPRQEGQPVKHLSAEDTLRINDVGSPQLSPDGRWVVYTQSSRDMDDADLRSVNHIWRVRPDGSERRQLTYGDRDCYSPQWFPDSRRIAFLTVRGAKQDSGGDSEDSGPGQQIHYLWMDGGEAWKATDHEEGVRTFSVSADGKKIAFIAQDPLSEEEKEKQKKRDDAEVVDQKFRWSHLWVLDVESNETRRLTEGEFIVSDPQWSPDSTRIAYVTRPNDKLNESWRTDVWWTALVDGQPRKLQENPGNDSNPRWSPLGSTIAFLSEPTAGTSTWHQRILIADPEGGAATVLLEDPRYDPGALDWAPDGKSLYFSAGKKTSINLFAVDLQKGISEISGPEGANFGWDLSADGSRWVWVHTGPGGPAEIYTAGADLSGATPISDANPWLRDEGYELADVEVIRWRNSDGQEIEGVLTKPVGFQAGARYPLILNPHGGPSGAVLRTFQSTNQFLAAKGFLVLQPNFRGSSNYGQEFLNANRGNWGIVDYDDCMKGVDYTIEQGWADPDRLVCYGWSYGGYMSFWISTQTDRFKAISPGAGLSNLYSMYGTTDIPHYLGWFFGNPSDRNSVLGTPWDVEEAYERHSPIRHVKNVTSPILILHGARDARVPPEQAVEFYQALRDLGKDVTFIRYPREGHGLREPRHQVDRLNRYLEFFSKHVGMKIKQEKPPVEVNQ